MNAIEKAVDEWRECCPEPNPIDGCGVCDECIEKLIRGLNKVAIPKTLITKPDGWISKDVLREKIKEAKDNIKINQEGVDLKDDNSEHHRCNKSANEEFLRLLEDLLGSEEKEMVCSQCGEVCEDYNAYCLKCGRSPHRLKEKVSKEEK